MTKNHVQLTGRDVFFAMINGSVFGLGLTIISNTSIPYFVHLSYIVVPVITALLAVCGIVVGALLARWKVFFFQLSKFAVIGAANTAVDLGVYNFLIFLSGGVLEAGIIIFFYKSISFAIAVINSYFWNRYWSFATDQKPSSKEFMNFLSISVIGLLINASLTTLFSFFFAVQGTVSSTGATIAAAIASLIVLLWNFIGYKLIVFKK